MQKKAAITICIAVFIISVYFLYSNILLLDDFHPKTVETMQDNPEQTENPDEKQQPDNQNAEPEVKNPIPQKGFHLHINLDQCMMYVYKNGVLQKTYPVSGGKRTTPSPVGNWRIISKDTWGEGFGGAWLGFNVPWGKYGIHGTVYPWQIGNTNGSKGCIRMKNKDVRELYKIVPHGTTVSIIHDSQPFRALKNGDIGSDVAEIQKALKKLGYYHGGIDGKFGNGLKQSVIKFQKANKIRSTGVVGNQTYNALKEQIKGGPSTP